MEPENQKRREIVTAVMDWIDRSDVSELLPSKRKVSELAGVSASTVGREFRQYPHDLAMRIASLAAFEDAQGERVMHNLHAAVGALQRLAQKRDSTLEVFALIQSEAEDHFKQLIEARSAWRRQIFSVWAILWAPKGETRNHQQEDRAEFLKITTGFYQNWNKAHSALYEEFLNSWKRVPRQPLSYDDLSILVTALTEGMQLRHTADAEMTDDKAAKLYGDGVRALIYVLTTTEDDDRQVSDLV